jgi:hypothetical protein
MNALQLIQLIEGLIAAVLPGLADLKGIVTGSADTNAALADADATYQQVIANAQAALAIHIPPAPPATSPVASVKKPKS